MMNYDLFVGQRLRAARLRKGWSATKLATTIGLTQSFVSRVEKGLSAMGLSYLHAAARQLGTTVPALTDFDDNVSTVMIPSRRMRILVADEPGAYRALSEGAPMSERDVVEVDIARPTSSFGLRLTNDSMSPAFPDGDMVIIDPTRRPRPGKFVAAANTYTGEITFRQYREMPREKDGRENFELVPLNESYRVLRSNFDPIAVLGVLSGLLREFKD